MDAEALVVWALRDHQAHRLTGGQVAEYGWLHGGTQTAKVLRHVSLGATVTGGGSDLHDAPDAAVRVAEAVRSLPPDARRLVLRYGRLGSRPDWSAGWALQYRRAGDCVVDVVDGCIVRYSPVRLHLEDTEVRWARAEWTLWRESLCVLAEWLGVPPPMVAAEPWQSDPVQSLLTTP